MMNYPPLFLVLHINNKERSLLPLTSAVNKKGKNMGNYAYEQEQLTLRRISKLLSSSPWYFRGFAEHSLNEKGLAAGTVYYAMIDVLDFVKHIGVMNDVSVEEVSMEMISHVSEQDIRDYMRCITTRTSGSLKKISNEARSRNKKLSSIRSLYRYLMSQRFLYSDPTLLIKAEKTRKKSSNHLRDNETKGLLDCAMTGDGLTASQYARTSGQRLRDHAIIMLILKTGIKVGECAALDIDDIDWKEKELIVERNEKKIRIPVDNDTLLSLEEYINTEKYESILDPDALFISKKRRRMSVSAIERMVKKYAAASILDKSITPHALRETFAVQMYKETKDPFAVASALSVADVNVLNTIERYVGFAEKKPGNRSQART